MKSKKGAAEWYWIIVVIIIVLIVAIFFLTLFTDFGIGVKESFANILDLATNPPGG